jgi:hypothetical protein
LKVKTSSRGSEAGTQQIYCCSFAMAIFGCLNLWLNWKHITFSYKLNVYCERWVKYYGNDHVEFRLMFRALLAKIGHSELQVSFFKKKTQIVISL